MERKVCERTAELAAVNKELEAFAYSVAHDLRAPLRHIDGFTRILADQLDDQAGGDTGKTMGFILKGTREMSQLIESLLSLSRIGKHCLQVSATNLQSILEEVVEELAAETSSRNVDWRKGDLPLQTCDPALFKQVLGNLLSNAVKFTKSREIAVIETGSLEQNCETVIFVRDNGVGFEMQYADKLFGVFQRLHRQEDFPGTRVRAGHRPPHHSQTWATHLGRSGGGSRRDLLFHAGWTAGWRYRCNLMLALC